MTPLETALRNLFLRMRWRDADTVKADFGPAGMIVATIVPAPGFDPDDDHPPLDEVCPCGHLLAEEHGGGGCLLGCSDSRCNKRQATMSQLEHDVFAPIFDSRPK